MMKTIGKILYKILILLFLSFFLMLIFSQLVRPDGGKVSDNTHDKVEGFYALEKNSLDVLFLGTSHAYYAFNPAVLWKETGLTSYIFAGQCQPIEVTFHFLIEALKTQRPQLVVLDLFALGEQANKCLTKETYRVNIQNMEFSKNKFDAYQLIKDEDPLTNMFDIILYKNKLKTIDNNFLKPFEKEFNSTFGYTLNYTLVNKPYSKDFDEDGKKKEVDKVKFEYLKKIINVLNENKIPLLLVKTPYYIDQIDYEIYNSIWEYAKSQNIATIDFNEKVEEMGFDYNQDCDSWHTNATGSLKVTNYLANYIHENYNFKGTRIENYDNLYADLYAKSVYAIMSRCYNITALLQYMKEFDVSVIISYDKQSAIYMEKPLYDELTSFGLDFSRNKQKIIYSDGEIKESDELKVTINHHHYEIIDNNLWIDNKWIDTQNKSLRFIVIDNETGYPVDNFQVDFFDQIYIYRK